MPGSSIMAAVMAGVASMAMVACDSGEPVDPGSDLPSRLLPGDALPDGFTVVPAQVSELVAANRSTLKNAESVRFDPVGCKPTADAKFNPHLNEGNTAFLVGRSAAGTFTELVSTQRRDVDADRRDTSGPCRVVTASPTAGGLAGARIVTTSSELPVHGIDGAEQAYLLRTDSVTTLADGGVRARSAYMANLLVQSTSGRVITLQVGIAGQDAAVEPERVEKAGPNAALSDPPVSESAFTGLVRKAAERAATA
ncbi:hypothetical protein [Gordonia zhaorongruii]|uniref:hypothetical protein n=1 Tax=Gordonia zhaorongruii TaxID=2597659 RepID=UPI001FD41CB6|nr:hypothetical protein [Gordonia zhaorongruii]